MKKFLTTLAMSMTIVVAASANSSWPASSFGKYPSWPVMEGKYPSWPVMEGKYPSWPFAEAKFPKYPAEPKFPKYPYWPSWPASYWPNE